jgi:hypothetical protein
MSKTLTKGYADTAISGGSSQAFTLAPLNFGADFRILSNVAGEVVLTNVTCPADQPETIRVSQREVTNIYANTNIDTSAYAPVKNGTATLIEMRGNWVETDSTDASWRKIIPVKVGLTLTLPAYGSTLTGATLLNFVSRAVSAAFEQNTNDSTGLVALQHGVLLKKAVTS